jgi:NitT/TauT family transport system ATP-binding protein
VFVTHDIDEALYLADRVVVFSSKPGRIREIIPVPFGRPRQPQIKLSAEFQTVKARLLASLQDYGNNGSNNAS